MVEPAAVHPGEMIRDALEERNMSQKKLAERSGLTPKHISQIVNGRSGIGMIAARRISAVLAISARDLIMAQAGWDVEHGRTRSRH